MARRLTRRSALGALGLGASGLALSRTLAAVAGPRRDADVIVIGAGLAGLQAAVMLQDEGLDALVVEGNDRVGGRVWSLDHVPGQPEAGGAEIAPDYARMHEMIRRIGGIKLSSWAKFNADRSFAIYDSGTLTSLDAWRASPANRFGAKEQQLIGPRGPFEVALAYLPYPNPLTGLDSWLHDDVAALDVPLGQFLRNRGASDEALRFVANSIMADSLSSISALLVLRWMRFMEGMGSLDGLRLFDQGTSRVPEGMAAMLKRAIRMRSVATGLRDRPDGAEVELADGTVLRAGFVVCTVPLPVLRRLRFDPPLPERQAAAVQVTPYGSAACIFFAIKEPFWEHDGLPPSTFSCTEFGRANLRNTPRGQHLWFFKSGLAGAALRGAGSDAEIARLTTLELHRARPSTVGRIEATAVVNWNSSPWTLGHLSSRGPGEIRRFGNVVAEPHGHIHFAGEHTAPTMLGMEGAMESGEQAAVAILSRLGGLNQSVQHLDIAMDRRSHHESRSLVYSRIQN